MATMTDITTGVQTVTGAGAVTGALATSALTGDYTVCLRVDALPAAETAIVALQDTAHAGSPFSEAITVAVWHFVGGTAAEFQKVSVKKHQIPGTRFGAANTQLRFNVLSKTASGNMKVYGWLEQ